VEGALVELAVLLDEVVQDVEPAARVVDAADQRRHRAGEERDREEELLLRPAEARQVHRPVLQRPEERVAEDVDLSENLGRPGGDPRGAGRDLGGRDRRLHRQTSAVLMLQWWRSSSPTA